MYSYTCISVQVNLQSLKNIILTSIWNLESNNDPVQHCIISNDPESDAESMYDLDLTQTLISKEWLMFLYKFLGSVV